ncbi:MAG: amidohydrolase family protein, partial [Anaerolineae bacterium]|nr:amidohydrolase family protein [Anaerolineae bacterium]
MFDCVIQHGSLIATPALRKQLAEAGDGSNPDLIRADIGILDGKIAAIGQNLQGRSVIAADDRLVIPGGVDPHVHLEMNAGALVTSDTWATGSRAAALGGTTTVIDFVEPAYAHQPLMEAFQQRL